MAPKPGSAADSPPKIAAILAGGRSRRFGSDKVFARLHGKPLIEHVMGALEQCGFAIVISANDPERFAQYSYRVIQDTLPGQGPLQALCGLCTTLQCSQLLLAAADMPLISSDLFDALWVGARSHDIVILEDASRVSPLPGVYSQRAAACAACGIEQGRLDLQFLFERDLHVRRVSNQQCADPLSAAEQTVNINTYRDLLELKQSRDHQQSSK